MKPYDQHSEQQLCLPTFIGLIALSLLAWTVLALGVYGLMKWLL